MTAYLIGNIIGRRALSYAILIEETDAAGEQAECEFWEHLLLHRPRRRPSARADGRRTAPA